MGTLWVPHWKTLNQSQNGARTKPVCHILDEQGEAQLISQLASAFSSATLAIYLFSPRVSSLKKCTHNLSILHPGLWRWPVHLWPSIHPQVTASPTLLSWNCKDMPNDQEEESGEVILQRNHPPLILLCLLIPLCILNPIHQTLPDQSNGRIWCFCPINLLCSLLSCPMSRHIVWILQSSSPESCPDFFAFFIRFARSIPNRLQTSIGCA
jgi:hypothetical protein